MEFIELAKKRCSVRKYEEKKVEDEKFEKILEAGRVAPTAANRQPQKILAIRSEEGLEKLKKAANVYGAPLVFVICADLSAVWKRSYDGKLTTDIDASIVATHMMLEAADLGLGTLWVCHFDPAALKAQFAVPERIEPVNILAVGYASGEVKSSDRFAQERKPLSETVYYETF